jgi:hypothetical protein
MIYVAGIMCTEAETFTCINSIELNKCDVIGGYVITSSVISQRDV